MIHLSDSELLSELKKRFSEKDEALKQLKELNIELEKVNNKLKESESLKSHFISNIANEIVNPFASIIGLARNIINTDIATKPDAVLNIAKLIYNDAQSLDFQLKNIFMAAKLEAGEFEPFQSKIYIPSVIDEIKDDFSVEIAEKSVNIEYIQAETFDGFVISDNDAFKLILSNLISNAIKFSDSDESIEVISDKNTEFWSVKILNTGQCISTEDKQKIFERFHKAEKSVHSLNKGQGLGLSVVQEITSLFGGSIDLFETDNAIVFECKLPVEDENVYDISLSGNEVLFNYPDEQLF
jgi:signal transduction histidine kinase